MTGNTELQLSGFTVERHNLGDIRLMAVTIERYQDPSPPRVSLRGFTVERHRANPKRRRLFRKQWW